MVGGVVLVGVVVKGVVVSVGAGVVVVVSVALYC